MSDQTFGIEQLARETGIEVVNCPTAEYVDLVREENRYLSRIRVPKVVRDTKILNLPKLKRRPTGIGSTRGADRRRSFPLHR